MSIDAEKYLQNRPHKECMELLSDWKDCHTLFKEVYHNQYYCVLQNLSSFSGVEFETLKKVYNRHSSLLEEDGCFLLKGQELMNARDKLSLPSKISWVRLITPRGALRIILKLQIKNITDEIETILMNNAQENKKMKQNQKSKKKQKSTHFNVRIKEHEDKIITKLCNKYNISRTELFRKLLRYEVPELDNNDDENPTLLDLESSINESSNN